MTTTETSAPTDRAHEAYLAVPVPTSDRPGPWPGVVVVHDVFGRGNDMLEQADWLGAAGYLTSVPDLFDGKRSIGCVRRVFAQLTAQSGPVFDEIERARAALAADPRCTGTVGVIGYCMGGGFALLLAGRPGWDAASVNYGMVPDNVAEILAGACPLVGSFGGRDRALPGAADTLASAAAAAGVTADVKEYPRVGHAFMNRLAAASPLNPLMKVLGMSYDHDAAADAKRRILAFFDEHLR